MKNLLIIVIFLSILTLVNCEPVVPQKSIVQKQLIFDNYNYENSIGAVTLGPLVNGTINLLENPTISLNEDGILGVSFDLLTDQFENLSFRLVHCNKDWSKSQLRDMEFLREINNFRVTDFDYSVNTVQPYINYRATLPKPFLSGNYLLVVFKRTNPYDLLFTRKFIVYQTSASIDQVVKVSSTVSKREENQQVEFTVNYGNLLVNSPTQDIYPVILQNHNWYTAIEKIVPTLILANQGTIEYRNLDLSTNFSGWNEFRFVDLRTLGVAGRNVAKITTNPTSILASLRLSKTRAKDPYSLNFNDINGRFIHQNNDNGEGFLNADYANVRFYLKSEQLSGDVYVSGRFNNWSESEENKMRYDQANEMYSTSILLKQGYYEYLYKTDDPVKPDHQLEGSHFQTENEYEILVYYRRPGNIHDEIIGYTKFGSIPN